MSGRQDRAGRIAAAVSGVVLLGVLVAGAVIPTIAGSNSGGPGTGNPVVTIQVVDQTYKVELANPQVLQIAQQLLAKEIPPMIPNGLIVRDSPGPNAPWSWHIDPASFQWAEMTTEVCDGLPSYVEDGSLTSPYYCPWAAEVIAIE